MWFPGLPSAGGNPPVWHVEHWLVTLTWVWLNLVVVHAPVVLWQDPTGIERDGDVIPGLSGRARAVVAGGAIRCRRKGTVINLGTRPHAGGFVAGLAIGRDAVVRRVVRATLARREIANVTGMALGRHRHACMELGRRPRGEARLVTGIAVRTRRTRHGLIWNMRGIPAVGWREGTAVAGRALPGNRALGTLRVRKPARFPGGSRRVMAAEAVSSRGNMRVGLAGCRAAVVA